MQGRKVLKEAVKSRKKVMMRCKVLGGEGRWQERWEVLKVLEKGWKALQKSGTKVGLFFQITLLIAVKCVGKCVWLVPFGQWSFSFDLALKKKLTSYNIRIIYYHPLSSPCVPVFSCSFFLMLSCYCFRLAFICRCCF